ncbi:MAG: CoA transferase [Ktedonobacterales bacterium]|nr:CoA transferase [Ktedonobacterales bacterium]
MLALEGVRVLDLSRALAGPFCAMILGDLGAEVIKVEEPGVGDDSRQWGPPFQGGESAYFLSANRNKRGIALNLKREGGREALWRLIERADVLVENFRPGLMTRLGFGYETVHARVPRLIYCSISGFGQDGPEARRSAYDIILQGMSGVTALTGDPDGSPMRSALPVCDILAGMFATQAILAALYARERTGRGQWVETTLLGATVAALGNYASSYLMTGNAPGRVGNQHPQIAPYDLLRAGDGYCNVAAGNDDLWRRFCAALALEPLLEDARFTTNADRVRHRAALLAAIEARTTLLPADEVVERLERAGVPAGPIRDMAQVFASPQAHHLGLARTMAHPLAGEVGVVNSPLLFSETPAELRLPPPTLGQHTEEVLRELGYDAATIARWRADGTL